MRQILTNLAGNAVKFTETGHVLVEVSGSRAEGDQVALSLAVEDTGIGIAKEHIDHIFGEFNQVEDQANRRFEGTGLGLAITRRLVGLMGGSMSVDSTAGKGSRFVVRLPLPAVPTQAAPPLPLASAGLRGNARVRRVLVIDADPVERAILERQLAALGMETASVDAWPSGAGGQVRGPFDAVLAAAEALPAADEMPSPEIAGDAIDSLVVIAGAEAAGMPHPKGARVLQRPVSRATLIGALSGCEGRANAAAASRAMRILAAEDNRTNQLVLARMVKDWDIALTFAANGHEAVAAWAALSPDLIFMDISMPGMDGREAARAIRAQEAARGDGARVPIVALTAHALDGDAEAILAAGIDRYLTKPLRKAAIEDAVRSYRPPEARAPVPGPGRAAGEDVQGHHG
jgi:hypothetical protein